MPQEAARPDRQRGNDPGPFFAREIGALQSRRGDRGMRLAEPADQFGIAEPPAVFAHDRGAFGSRDHVGQRDQPEIGRRLERGVAATLRPFTQQVEQLPELRLRRALAGGAVAQHSGKAIVEMHGFSGGGEGLRQLPHRRPGFLPL